MIFILGPCAMESEENYISTGRLLYELMGEEQWFYKASFDKANRTSIEGKRGIGINDGIDLFTRIKELLPDIRLITDIHEPWQAEILADIIDAVQIPAFLCRQTDLITEAARHFNIVNIKKGQWINPYNAIKSIDKIRKTNSSCQAWLTERGSMFGYDRLLVDFSIVDEIKKYYDKFIFDCTHSTQKSAKIHGVHGDSDLAKKYFLSSVIFGYDGVFAEVHIDPKNAISDGDCQISIKEYTMLYKNLYNMTL